MDSLPESVNMRIIIRLLIKVDTKKRKTYHTINWTLTKEENLGENLPPHQSRHIKRERGKPTEKISPTEEKNAIESLNPKYMDVCFPAKADIHQIQVSD